MHKKHIIYILILLISSSSLLYGQEELMTEFDAFTRNLDKEFTDRTRQMNKEFADYLRQDWVQFDTHVNPVPLQDPDTPVIKGNYPRPVASEVKPLPPLQQTPKDEIGHYRPKHNVKQVDFFGLSLSIPFSNEYAVIVDNVQENAISRAWSRAAEIDYTALFTVLRKYKKELQLNDWGYLQLIRKTVDTFYPASRAGHSIPFLTVYLLNQESYAARLGRMNKDLVLLLEINETIYGIPQMKNRQQLLSVFSLKPLPKSISVHTYKNNLPIATRSFSLQMPVLPVLGRTIHETNLPYRWQLETVAVKVNQSLIDFYDTFPQCEFSVYLHAGTSDEIKELCRYLSRFVKGKNETETVGILLDFIQHTFSYQSDTQQFGYEKVFFPDEMLFYPHNDCEDRAILFCKLVTELTGLPVALVNYPNHIAAAVQFNAEVSGTTYRSGEKRYTLCDPTYINAGIGECMPKFVGVKGDLIL